MYYRKEIHNIDMSLFLHVFPVISKSIPVL